MSLNLKEAFRFTRKINDLFHEASRSIGDRNHALKITKKHLRKAANPEAEDKTEEVDVGEFYKNDDVLSFMRYLMGEKELLVLAIRRAKASCEVDIDGAAEVNKLRQGFRDSIDSMLRNTASKKTERGSDYKFNVEGNQTGYTYEIEVEYTEAYDRAMAKEVMRSVITSADSTSKAIDEAMINTIVNYSLPFDVNDSFDDAIENFLKR